MSAASRSKSKDKKAGKESAKVSSKSSIHVNTGPGIAASGYNPLLGTFHTFETAPLPSASVVHANGRFRNIDDTDDHIGNSLGTGFEYDSVSNNDSWSGESEDHKDKTSQNLSHQDPVPGAENDKREKIRLKNERKHQRQKERRAQELRERCSGYLMSRKLEALAQQLVTMGFSHDRATMALIMNEGRVEESVVWLLEGGEEEKNMEHKLEGVGNLKIDISDELAWISAMESRYKVSKQEVERAVVSCEGDLDKAEDTIKAQKQEPPAPPPKPVETNDPPTLLVNRNLPVALSQNAMRVQVKPTAPVSIQQKRDERDFNYAKVPTTVVGSSLEPTTKSTLVLKKIPPKSDWPKQQQTAVPAEKRWQSAGSTPSVSYPLASPLQQPPLTPSSTKSEPLFVAVGNELKNLQLGSVREPVIVMQRPQSINAKQTPGSSISSSPPGSAAGWYPNAVEKPKPNGLVPPVAASRTLMPNAVTSNTAYNQLHHQPQLLVSSSSAMDPQGTTRSYGMWSRGNSSPTLAAASSLGLFSGIGANISSGISSPMDWTTGTSTLPLDYNSIDWSLDLGELMSRPNGLWNSANYNGRTYDSFGYGPGYGQSLKSAMRSVPSNGNGVSISRLPNGAVSSEPSVGGASWDWSSPFEERDLFNLPRQFVSTSPSL